VPVEREPHLRPPVIEEVTGDLVLALQEPLVDVRVVLGQLVAALVGVEGERASDERKERGGLDDITDAT